MSAFVRTKYTNRFTDQNRYDRQHLFHAPGGYSVSDAALAKVLNTFDFIIEGTTDSNTGIPASPIFLSDSFGSDAALSDVVSFPTGTLREVKIFVQAITSTHKYQFETKQIVAGGTSPGLLGTKTFSSNTRVQLQADFVGGALQMVGTGTNSRFGSNGQPTAANSGALGASGAFQFLTGANSLSATGPAGHIRAASVTYQPSPAGTGAVQLNPQAIDLGEGKITFNGVLLGPSSSSSVIPPGRITADLDIYPPVNVELFFSGSTVNVGVSGILNRSVTYIIGITIGDIWQSS